MNIEDHGIEDQEYEAPTPFDRIDGWPDGWRICNLVHTIAYDGDGGSTLIQVTIENMAGQHFQGGAHDTMLAARRATACVWSSEDGVLPKPIEAAEHLCAAMMSILHG